MSLNTKSLNIDNDRAVFIVAPTSSVTQNVNFVRNNTYVLQANCYSNSQSNVFSTFANTDSWALYISDTYGSNSNPIVVVDDQSRWNNVADYALSNVVAGIISCRCNVSGSALDADLANVSSKNYTVEIVLTNDVSGRVMIADSTCSIKNAVQI
jgi:hypothetical protein